MTLTIDITPEMETRLQQEAAKHGQEPSAIVTEALDRVLPPTDQEDARIEAGWDALTKLIEQCQMDTGITDLAHQHDHYLYGTPKREPYPPEEKMTHTVKGHYKDGVVTLDKPVEGLEEADVTVTLTPHPAKALKPMTPEGWTFLTKILENAKMETGIPDLAHEHDHYIHGTPKRGDAPDR